MEREREREGERERTVTWIWKQGRPHLKARTTLICFFFFLYNNLKFFICLPFKKGREYPQFFLCQ